MYILNIFAQSKHTFSKTWFSIRYCPTWPLISCSINLLGANVLNLNPRGSRIFKVFIQQVVVFVFRLEGTSLNWLICHLRYFKTSSFLIFMFTLWNMKFIKTRMSLTFRNTTRVKKLNKQCWRLVDETLINKLKRTHANSLLEIL